MLHAPRGLGAGAACMALSFCIAQRIGEFGTVTMVILLTVPAAVGILYHLHSGAMFLKLAGGSRDKADKYAEHAELLAYVLAIVIIAVFYHLGFFNR